MPPRERKDSRNVVAGCFIKGLSQHLPGIVPDLEHCTRFVIFRYKVAPLEYNYIREYAGDIAVPEETAGKMINSLAARINFHRAQRLTMYIMRVDSNFVENINSITRYIYAKSRVLVIIQDI